MNDHWEKAWAEAKIKDWLNRAVEDKERTRQEITKELGTMNPSQIVALSKAGLRFVWKGLKL